MAKTALQPASLAVATALHRSLLVLARRLRASRGSGMLSTSKLLVLGALQRGIITSAGLAAELQVQPQSLTRVLNELADDRLISRRADMEDRRRSLITLTAAGSAALREDLLARRRRLADAMQRALTPAECATLRLAAGLMERLAAAVAPDPTQPTEPGEGLP